MTITENNSQTNTFSKGLVTDLDPMYVSNNQYISGTNVMVKNGILSALPPMIKMAYTEGNNYDSLTWLLTNDYKVVGYNVIDNYGIVFLRHTKSTYSIIMRITFTEPNELLGSSGYTELVLKPIVNTVVKGNYAFGDHVESVFDKTEVDVTNKETVSGVSQSEKVIKTYFVDGINPLRSIVINGPAYDNNYAIDVVKEFTFYPLKFVGLIGGGQLPLGRVQYAYQLFSERGSLSPSSPLTELILINIPLGNLSGNSTNSAVLKVKIDETANYDYIRLFCIHYTNKDAAPTVNVITQDIRDQIGKEVQITDTGGGYSELVGDQYSVNALPSSVSNDLISSTITKIANRLFLASTNTEEAIFDVNIDTRAYRGCYDNVKDIPIAKYLNNLIEGINIDIILGDSSNEVLTDTMDLINPYNETFNVNNTWDYGMFYPEDTYPYKWFGGKGKVVSYKLVVTEMPLDKRSLYGKSAGNLLWSDHKDQYRPMNGSVSTSGYENTYYIGIDSRDGTRVYEKTRTPVKVSANGLLDYSNSNVQTYLTGYTRDEVYRFGIVFYNSKMNASPVHWIADIKMPSDKLAPAFTFGGSTKMYSPAPTSTATMRGVLDWQCCALPLGVQFMIDVRKLPKEVVGYEIVRAPRTVKDRKILTQGVISYIGKSSYYEASMPFPYLTFLATGYENNQIVSDIGINSIYWSKHNKIRSFPNHYTTSSFTTAANAGLVRLVDGVRVDWADYSDGMYYFKYYHLKDNLWYDGVLKEKDISPYPDYSTTEDGIIDQSKIIFISPEACVSGADLVDNVLRDKNTNSIYSILGVSQLSSSMTPYEEDRDQTKFMDTDLNGYSDAFGYCMDNVIWSEILRWLGENNIWFPTSESKTRWGRFSKANSFPLGEQYYSNAVPYSRIRTLWIPSLNKDGRNPHICKYYIPTYEITDALGNRRSIDDLRIDNIEDTTSSSKAAREKPAFSTIVWINEGRDIFGNTAEGDTVRKFKLGMKGGFYCNVSETFFKGTQGSPGQGYNAGPYGDVYRSAPFRVVGPHGPCLIIYKNNLLSEFNYGINGDINTILKVNLVCNNTNQYGGYGRGARDNTQYISLGNYTTVDNGGNWYNCTNIYAGDTFLSILDYPVTMQCNLYPGSNMWNGSNRQAYIGAWIPVESSVNLARMYSDNSFIPASNYKDYNTDRKANPYIQLDAVGTIDYFGENATHFNQNLDLFLYNNANSIFDSGKLFATGNMYDTLKTTNRYSIKITYSDKKQIGELKDAWSVFSLDNVTLLDAQFGNINKLFTFKDRLYILLDKAVSILQIEPLALLSTSTNPEVLKNELLLGSTDKLGKLMYISQSYGLDVRDLKTFCITDKAAYWLDRNNRELIMFNGESVSLLNSQLKCKSLLNLNTVDLTYWDKQSNMVMFCRNLSPSISNVSRGIAFDLESNYFTGWHNRMFVAVFDINKSLQAGIAPDGNLFLVNGEKTKYSSLKDKHTGFACQYVTFTTPSYNDVIGNKELNNLSSVTFAVNKYPDTTKVFDYFVFPVTNHPNEISDDVSYNKITIRNRNGLVSGLRQRELDLAIPCPREMYPNTSGLRTRSKNKTMKVTCVLDIDIINKLSYVKTVFRQSKF